MWRNTDYREIRRQRTSWWVPTASPCPFPPAGKRREHVQWSLRLFPDSQGSRGGLGGMVGRSKVSSFILAAPCQGRGPPPRAAHFLLLTIKQFRETRAVTSKTLCIVYRIIVGAEDVAQPGEWKHRTNEAPSPIPSVVKTRCGGTRMTSAFGG